MWTPLSQSGITIDGPTITSTVDDHKKKNFLWTDEPHGINDGEHFWTFQFDKLDPKTIPSIGLSNDARFDQGYCLQGLMCHYNLFDGGSLLVMDFGPEISTGDKMGLLATFTEEVGRLKIYLYHNDRPLGLAYNIPSSSLPNARPVVSLDGKGCVKIEKEAVVPSTSSDRKRPLLKFTGIEGVWKTNEIEIDDNKVEGDDTVTMTIKGDSDDKKIFGVHLHVFNSISFRVEKTENTWKTGDTSSTRMLGSVEAMEMEQAMTRLCHDPESVELTLDDGGDAQEVMTIRNGRSTASFVRYDDSPGPYEGDPFARFSK